MAENKSKIKVLPPSNELKSDILAIIQKNKGDNWDLARAICVHIMKRDKGLTLL